MHISETLTKIVIDNNQTIVLSRTQMMELRDLLNKHLDPLGGYSNPLIGKPPSPIQFYSTNPDILSIPCSSVDVGVGQFPLDDTYTTCQPIFDNQNYGCITGDSKHESS